MELLTGHSDFPCPDSLDDLNLFNRIDDLAVWTDTIEGHPSAFVQMPPPERSPLAFFVGVVFLVQGEADIWQRDAPCRLFTLERYEAHEAEAQSRGVLCEWTSEREHRNLGLTVSSTRGDFVAAITNLLRGSVREESLASFYAKTGRVKVVAPGEPLQRKRPWWKFWSN